MEVGYVVIQIRLADLGIGGEDVHDKGAEIDGVETFGGVVKNSVVGIVDRHRKLVACDGEDHLVGVQCLTGDGVGGAPFLAFGDRGACWGEWVGWRFNIWDVEHLPVVCQADGWILRKA